MRNLLAIILVAVTGCVTPPQPSGQAARANPTTWPSNDGVLVRLVLTVDRVAMADHGISLAQIEPVLKGFFTSTSFAMDELLNARLVNNAGKHVMLREFIAVHAEPLEP